MNQTGQDFHNFVERAKQLPEVSDYLDSFATAAGDLVLFRRLALGLTQTDLAGLAGRKKDDIVQIETGEEDLIPAILCDVLEVLGVNLSHANVLLIAEFPVLGKEFFEKLQEGLRFEGIRYECVDRHEKIEILLLKGYSGFVLSQSKFPEGFTTVTFFEKDERIYES